MLARIYAVTVRDEALFTRLLIEVLRTSPAVFPEQRLANEIAHRKARRYLAAKSRWFLGVRTAALVLVAAPRAVPELSQHSMIRRRMAQVPWDIVGIVVLPLLVAAAVVVAAGVGDESVAGVPTLRRAFDDLDRVARGAVVPVRRTSQMMRSISARILSSRAK